MNPSLDKNIVENVGVGGAENFIIPMLNDFYSGWESKQPWLKICLDKVSQDKDLYFILCKRFKPYSNNICKSFNSSYGVWRDGKNSEIYKKLGQL